MLSTAISGVRSAMRISFSFKDRRIQLRVGMVKPIRRLSTSFASSQQEMAEIHLWLRR